MSTQARRNQDAYASAGMLYPGEVTKVTGTRVLRQWLGNVIGMFEQTALRDRWRQP